MQILMFGWEFPPHISGGLGTACYGLTKSLTEEGDTGVTFVVPRAWGDESRPDMEIIGADQVPVARTMAGDPDSDDSFRMIGVRSGIIPYTSPEQFWRLKSGHFQSNPRFVEVTGEGTVRFTGSYGPALFREIRDYALVAAEIAGRRAYDVIHAHDWLTFPAGIAAKKETGKPLVVHVHSTEYDRTGGALNPAVYAIEREGMESADKVIAVSNYTRNTIIEKYGIPPGKVVTVHNAVEPLPENRPRDLVRIPGMKTVTFMGRITFQKGPEYFVEAAAMVLRTLPDVRFVMAGSGDMMNSVIGHAARLGISDRFHFTGFLSGDQVYHLLDVTDVFVMPSVSEPFGIAPLEAMQAGIPVIISRQSGVAEIVSYVVKADFWDTSAMADAIYGLLQYPALATLLSRHGIIEAGNLKWKHAAGRISEVYQQLTRLPGRTPLPSVSSVGHLSENEKIDSLKNRKNA